MNRDIIKYAIKNLLNRRTRSWLTILSILIGIMAIFALISFGVGVQAYVNKLSEDMGIGKIMIQPGGFSPPGSSTIEFSESNINAINNVIGVDVVTPLYINTIELKTNLKKAGKWNHVMGIPSANDQVNLMKQMLTVDVLKGRELRSQDKYKVVLGYSYTLDNKIFNKALKLRDTVYIKEIPFKVVGFYNNIGNPSDDANIYIPIATAQEIFDNKNYQMIMLQADLNKNPDEIVKKVKKALRKDRGLDVGKEDFTVQTFEDAIAVFTNIISVLSTVLVLIALVSVLVSAVNIANSMYTSVLERTNEIGVMKAIGAKNKTIRIIFLIESGMLGLMGGIIGIFFGYLIAKTGGNIAAAAGYASLQPAFPWWLIVSCLVFSFLVGMLSGYFPAKSASALKPVDALRFE